MDLGCRGEHANPGVLIIHRGKYRSMLKTDRERLRQKRTAELSNWHFKANQGLRRTWVKAAIGDLMHMVPCAWSLI